MNALVSGALFPHLFNISFRLSLNRIHGGSAHAKTDIVERV